MSDQATDAPATVKVTIDGREIDARPGELVIKVAQDAGIFIPRFCWHERLKQVGMCRMCLVEVEGVRGLPPSCTTTVTDGMVVHTQSPAVKKAQDGVLEFLLINHPLDCPVCDRGGECPLQDQTLSFGPGESRFVEEKRHFEKPVPISELVLLDRERCIQCGRCTRFADEIAGDPLIDFGERGGSMQVITYPDEPFTSYFSGNTVQICPVGALTARPYRFRARPWDLTSAETTCQTCAVGCRGALQSTSNRLVRLLGVDLDPVNQGWLCDKGRFGYEVVHAPDRVVQPMVRKDGELVECSWPEALDAAADGLRRALELHGPQSVAVLGGSRGTNEDAYLWARLAKGVIGTDNVDAQLGDGLPADVALGLPEATIDDLERAKAIVLLAPDLKEELPVLYLRVRRAAAELGVPLVDVGAADHGLTKYAHAVLRHLPGQQAATAKALAAALGGTKGGDATLDALADLVAGRDGDVVVVLGRPDVATAADTTVAAAGELLAGGARFLLALRRGNVRGALDLGLAPGFLPGRVTLDAGRERFAEAWGTVPAEPGLDAAGVLAAAAEGRIRALVLLGADVTSDFPDRTLATAGVRGAGFVIAVDSFLSDSNRHADVFLPAAMWGEKEGSTTNLEGRVTRVSAKVTAPGTAMADWRIAVELAARLDVDVDLEAESEVQDEIARVSPAHAELDAALLRRARDGVLLPVAEHRDAIVLEPLRIAVSDFSWEPIPTGSVLQERVDAADDATATAEAEVAEAEASQLGAADAAPETAAPALHRWAGHPPTPAAPGRDAYALRLVAGRKLYDAGRVVTDSPSLAPLTAEAALRVSPHDRDTIGVADGDRVRVTTARGSLVVAVEADPTVPVGIAVLPFNQRGPGPADLIDVSAPVTDLRVETVR